MKIEDLPKESLASGQRVTLLFESWIDNSPFVVHVTTHHIQPGTVYRHGFNLPEGGWSNSRGFREPVTDAWFIVYREKRKQRAKATNLIKIKAIRPGWLTLEEMTR